MREAEQVPVAQVNPYAPPAHHGEHSVAKATAHELKKPTLRGGLLRWGTVCSVSAVPSFILGMTISSHFLQIPLMLAGVCCFITGYVAIEHSAPWQRLMQRHVPRRCVMAAFGCRMSLTLLLPIGWANDMLCGIMSVGAVGFFFGSTEPLTNPLQIFLTTVVQGLVLNVEVYGVAIVFLGIAYGYQALRNGLT